jgi:hypothetical protein
MCEHARRRRQCSICDPENCYAGKYRNRLQKALRAESCTAAAGSTKSFGVPRAYLAVKSHIQKKMDLYNASVREQPDLPRMTFHTVVLDHIKPVFVCIRDNDPRDTINHYTNLQPLFQEDNLHKSHWWSQDDEFYWKKHILRQPEFLSLYMPVAQHRDHPALSVQAYPTLCGGTLALRPLHKSVTAPDSDRGLTGICASQCTTPAAASVGSEPRVLP